MLKLLSTNYFSQICRYACFPAPLICLLFSTFLYAQPGNAQTSSLQEGINYHYTTADTSAILSELKTCKTTGKVNKLDVYLDALDKSRRTGYIYGEAYALLKISSYYRVKGSYDSMLYYSEQALLHAKNMTQDRGLTGRVYNELGSYYFLKSQYPRCAYFYYKALIEIETGKVRTPRAQAQLYANISCLWLNMKEPAQALFYLERGEKLALAAHDTNTLIRILNGWGSYYTSIKPDTAKAISYYNRSLQLAKQAKDLLQEQIALVNIGNFYERNGQHQKAISLLKGIVAQSDQLPNYLSVSANVYYAAALCNLFDFATARKHLLYALQETKKSGYNQHLKVIYYLLGKTASVSGNAAATFDYMERSNAIADSITNSSNKQLTYELDSRYQASEKNKQLAHQQLILERQQTGIKLRNIWIWAITLITLLLVMALISFYRNFKRARQLQESLINNLRQTQEINQLRAQIKGEESERNRLAHELHDGVMSQLLTMKLNLNLLRNKHTTAIPSDQLSSVLHQLDETAIEVRKMAHNLTPDVLLHDGLSAAVSIYCEKVASNCGLQVTYQVQGEIPKLPPEIELLLYRMVQELLQNTIKHAEASEILVQISCWDDLLSITVEDNGKGFTDEKLNNGIGLEGIRMRVKSLNGQADIVNNNGTTVYLEFNILSLKSEAEYANKNNDY